MECKNAALACAPMMPFMEEMGCYALYSHFYFEFEALHRPSSSFCPISVFANPILPISFCQCIHSILVLFAGNGLCSPAMKLPVKEESTFLSE